MDICHLILECSEVSSDSVAEITDIVFPAKFKFNTLVFNVTRIDRRSSVSDDCRRSDASHDQVLGLLGEPVCGEREPVIEKSRVDTEVELL